MKDIAVYCDVGDILYFVDNNKITIGEVTMIQHTKSKGWKFRFTYHNPAYKSKSSFDDWCVNIGNVFFFTEEEAQEKLAKLKGEN